MTVNDVYSYVITFTSTWNIVKDTTNHIIENMIG